MNLCSIALLLAFLSVSVFGQQTTLITKKKSTYYEEYSVLTSDKETKHGSYLRLDKSLFAGYSLDAIGNFSNGLKDGYWEIYYAFNNIKAKGFYKDDIMDSIWVFYYSEGVPRKLVEVKSTDGISLQVEDADPVISKSGLFKDGKESGLWEYFDKHGELIQVFNHNTDSLIFLKDGDVNNRDAGFIGGEDLMYQHLYEAFRFYETMGTINTKVGLQSSTIVFNFSVDKNGDVVNIVEVENSMTNKKLVARATETVESLRTKWYPAVADGVPQHVTKTISFHLKVTSTTENYLGENRRSMSTTKGFDLIIKVE